MGFGDTLGWFSLHLADAEEWVKVAGTSKGSRASSCHSPIAGEAAEKPVEELEKHRIEQDILCSGAAQRAGSRHTASIHGGEREVLLESQKEQAQYDSKKKALELDESTPENDSTMSASVLFTNPFTLVPSCLVTSSASLFINLVMDLAALLELDGLK